MPCVLLLLESQHSQIIEAAQTLARTAAADRADWPGDLNALREMLARHDRDESQALRALGRSRAAKPLAPALDNALEAQQRLDAAAVSRAVELVSRLVAEHAERQEKIAFPALRAEHPESVRRALAERLGTSADPVRGQLLEKL